MTLHFGFRCASWMNIDPRVPVVVAAPSSHRAARCVLLAVFTSSGCSAPLALIPRGPHPAGGMAPIVVESPPPPVKVQVVSAPPRADCKWADGEWLWRGNEWRWQDGRWVTAPAECYFADAVFVWLPARDAPTGQLYYTRSQWYDRNTNKPCETPPVCVADSRSAP